MGVIFRWDWLEVHDGDNMAAPLIGDTTYCGTDIPNMFESTGHNLFVRFKTDYDVGKRGFEIVVDAGKNNLIYHLMVIFGCYFSCKPYKFDD